MDKILINNRLKITSDSMDKIHKDSVLNELKETNQVLQDFCIWIKGYLDADSGIINFNPADK